MGWFSDLWKRLFGENSLSICEGKRKLLFNKNTELVLENESLMHEIDQAKLAIEEEVDVADPKFLNQAKKPYLPYRQYISPGNKINGFVVQDPREMYAVFRYQIDLVEENNWKKLSRYEKLMSVWMWIANRNTRTYESDSGDNWQFAIETIYRKKGDCEDSTILFITTCKLLGITADKIFNAVGPTSFGYHSYPIVYLSAEDIAHDDKLSEIGWYIFESTLNGIPARPKKLVGSNYNIDNGLQNWRFAGQLKPKYYSQFNGSPQSKKPGAKKRILNNEKKRQAIQRAWEKEGLVEGD